MLKKATQIFIDCIFKISPPGYYQIINIGGAFLTDLNNIVPIFIIPTTGNKFLYKNIFRDIKLILEDNRYDINNITDHFMLDFEKGLQKAVKLINQNTKINGCYFHVISITLKYYGKSQNS